MSLPCCRMGLEPPLVRPYNQQRLESYWTWIYSYTTWEANREVYLYPENYIGFAEKNFQEGNKVKIVLF